MTAIGVGVLAVGNLHELQDARSEELGTALPYMNSLHNIGLTAKATANDERGYLLTADLDFLTEIDGRLATVDGYLEDARAASTGDQSAYLDELEAGLDAWSASMQAEFDLYAQDPASGIALAFGDTRDLRKVYEDSLAAGLEQADADLMAGASYEATVSSAVRTTIVLCALGVLLALGLGLFVGRGIRRSLARLQDAAGRLAAGDLTADTGVQQRDEIGRTAASLDEALASLRGVMATVVGAADAVAASSEELSASSAQISASAEETSAQSGVVAGAAEEVSRSVQTVAAGAEQMGASIREIAANAAEASDVASRAVTAAETTTATVAKLGESSAEIGNVVKVITSIAGADQPPRAQRHHRGRPRRRGRQGLRRRRQRGQGAGTGDGEGDRGHRPPGGGDPGRHDGRGGRDRGDQSDRRADLGPADDHRLGGGGADGHDQRDVPVGAGGRRRHRRDRPEHHRGL